MDTSPRQIMGGATIWARQTIESEIFYYKPAEWFKVWFYIIAKVNHKDAKQFKRGQGFFKYEWIQEKCGATQSQLDHCLRWLKSAKQIATQKKTRGFIITVLNYNLYQNLELYKSDTKSDTDGEMEAKQKRNRSDTINNNDNNDNNIEREIIKEGEIIREEGKKDVGLDKTSLTREELWSMCLKTKVDLNDVMRKYYSILDMIEAGEFQRRYPKHKNLKFTLMSWLRMDVARGYVEGANETERLLNTKRDPKTEAGRDFFERWEKGRKEGAV